MNSLLLLKSTYVWFIVIAIMLVFVAVLLGIAPIGLWIKCVTANAHISIWKLAGMKLRKMNVSMLVSAYINARKAGVNLTFEDLESHYLAGGNVEKIVDAMIAAKGAQLDLNIDTARAIDLANKDVMNAVKTSVSPIVIEVPEVAVMARDGIELKVKVRVTAKTNINRIIGGAGADTIIAKVSQGVVAGVCSAKDHNDAMENPETIIDIIMSKGFEKNLAFDIISVDVADIKIGRNIGAQLEADRAEAEMQIAQARAEERRSLAVAQEQEMRAKTQEMKAQLLDAQAEVPKAISTAFRAGQLGVMDYYKMQNVVADTNFKNSFSGKINQMNSVGNLIDKEDK